MTSRKSYHTNIKLLVARGSLPSHIKHGISRSNIFRWKHEESKKYTGMEFSDILTIEEFLKQNNAVRIMRSYLKISLFFSNIFKESKQFKELIKNNKFQIVTKLEEIRKQFSIKPILKILDISQSTFYHWVNEINFPCNNSPLKLCKRKYPNQLLSSEANLIKKLLTCEEFSFWPVSSIFAFAIKNGILYSSLSTWYKYQSLFGMKRSIPKKKHQKQGIRANAPNKIWHADFTIIKLLDGSKAFLYLLSDNFSRFILNWRVENIVSGLVRMETIKDAYTKYVIKSKDQTILLVDGGAENNNILVESYLDKKDVFIKKLVALTNIDVSNSMVEAQNKLLKYNYLFKLKNNFSSINELRKDLNWIIDDYNYKRPHCSLPNYQTPYEAYRNTAIDMESIKNGFEQARKLRIKQNSQERCGIC